MAAMRPFLCLSFLLANAIAAQAVLIQLDYSYDAANGNFFGLNPAARAAVDAAAADISNALAPSLGAVTTDTFPGVQGGTTATFDWSLNFDNPATGAEVTLNTFNIAVDTIVIYVGMRPLLGSTLGRGGPGGAGFGLSGSGSPSEWVQAVGKAESASNAVMPRGGGPVIGSLQGSSTLGSAVANYDLQYGAILGNVWFDSDTNNDGAIDSPAILDGSWHFDHTTNVAAGQNDFYSVAVHELLHSIGFGSSETWDDLANGTTWLGPAAQSLNGGSGSNLISGDGSHLASGLMSRRTSDFAAQEAALDPTLTAGTRKFLTEMDLAILQDLGYSTIPEPTVFPLLFAGATLFLRRRSR